MGNYISNLFFNFLKYQDIDPVALEIKNILTVKKDGRNIQFIPEKPRFRD